MKRLSLLLVLILSSCGAQEISPVEPQSEAAPVGEPIFQPTPTMSGKWTIVGTDGQKPVTGAMTLKDSSGFLSGVMTLSIIEPIYMVKLSGQFAQSYKFMVDGYINGRVFNLTGRVSQNKDYIVGTLNAGPTNTEPALTFWTTVAVKDLE